MHLSKLIHLFILRLSQSLKTKRSGGGSRQIMSSGGGREASAHNKLGLSEEGKNGDYMTSVFVDSTMAHALTRGMEEGRRRENSFGIKDQKKECRPVWTEAQSHLQFRITDDEGTNMKGKPSGGARERLYHNITEGEMTCATAGQHIVLKHTLLHLLKQWSRVRFPRKRQVEVKVVCLLQVCCDIGSWQ